MIERRSDIYGDAGGVIFEFLFSFWWYPPLSFPFFVQQCSELEHPLSCASLFIISPLHYITTKWPPRLRKAKRLTSCLPSPIPCDRQCRVQTNVALWYMTMTISLFPAFPFHFFPYVYLSNKKNDKISTRANSTHITLLSPLPFPNWLYSLY